jgi:hypothetical protein
MAEQTIEEAWAEFIEHLHNALDDARRGPHGSQPWPVDRARALALASAKAMLPPRSHPGAKTGIERRYLAVKAQIERLGR